MLFLPGVKIQTIFLDFGEDGLRSSIKRSAAHNALWIKSNKHKYSEKADNAAQCDFWMNSTILILPFQVCCNNIHALRSLKQLQKKC